MLARHLILILTLFLFAQVPILGQEEAEGPVEDAVEQSREGSEEKRTHKAGFRRKPAFGGPNSTEGQLEEDDRVKTPTFRFAAFDRAMNPWFEWKERVNEEHGFQLSGHYAGLYQSLDKSLGENDDGGSGIFRLNGSWTLLGRDSPNNGSIAFTLDQRHAYTDFPPSALAGDAGYIGVVGTLFSDAGGMVINLNWQQGFNDGKGGLIIGRYDPSDYMNVLGYGNPWTTFQNLAILLDASVAFPDSSWGIGAGHWLGDNVYAMASINDANGLGTDSLEFFEGGAEFFKQGGIGWTPSRDERYFKTVVVTGWHVDEREDLGIESASGFLLSANWTWNQQFMPFLRLGISDGSAPIYNTSVSAGFIYHFPYRSDLIGIGANWGESPAEDLPEQTTVEAFYRWQFAQNLAITPSVQYLVDPALNSEEDEVWLVGLRLRFTY